MVDVGKLSPVRTGASLVLHLGSHRCGVSFAHRRKFPWSCSHPDPARSAIETYTSAAPAVSANIAFVNVVHIRRVDIVDRAVVVEMAATPIAALVAEAHIAKAVVDAAIVANMSTPVAAIKAIAVMPKAPIARRPKCSFVRRLNPCPRYPVIALGTPSPIAGRPYIAFTGCIRLIVVGQRRRWFRSIGIRLLAITRIIRTLIGRLVSTIALFLLRRALLIAGLRRGCVLCGVV